MPYVTYTSPDNIYTVPYTSYLQTSQKDGLQADWNRWCNFSTAGPAKLQVANLGFKAEKFRVDFLQDNLGEDVDPAVFTAIRRYAAQSQGIEAAMASFFLIADDGEMYNKNNYSRTLFQDFKAENGGCILTEYELCSIPDFMRFPSQKEADEGETDKKTLAYPVTLLEKRQVTFAWLSTDEVKQQVNDSLNRLQKMSIGDLPTSQFTPNEMANNAFTTQHMYLTSVQLFINKLESNLLSTEGDCKVLLTACEVEPTNTDVVFTTKKDAYAFRETESGYIPIFFIQDGKKSSPLELQVDSSGDLHQIRQKILDSQEHIQDIEAAKKLPQGYPNTDWEVYVQQERLRLGHLSSFVNNLESNKLQTEADCKAFLRKYGLEPIHTDVVFNTRENTYAFRQMESGYIPRFFINGVKERRPAEFRKDSEGRFEMVFQKGYTSEVQYMLGSHDGKQPRVFNADLGIDSAQLSDESQITMESWLDIQYVREVLAHLATNERISLTDKIGFATDLARYMIQPLQEKTSLFLDADQWIWDDLKDHFTQIDPDHSDPHFHAILSLLFVRIEEKFMQCKVEKQIGDDHHKSRILFYSAVATLFLIAVSLAIPPIFPALMATFVFTIVIPTIFGLSAGGMFALGCKTEIKCLEVEAAKSRYFDHSTQISIPVSKHDDTEVSASNIDWNNHAS